MEGFGTIALIEGVLVFGGALAFGWWQLHSIKRDQAEAARKRADEEAARGADAAADEKGAPRCP